MPSSKLSFTRALTLAGGLAAAAGCGTGAPANPTWVEVQPILAGECAHCHGSTAKDTGGAYRFDFFDMTADVCGDAAQALSKDTPLAKDLSQQIWKAITTTQEKPGQRPTMPPPPAPYLEEREWRTIQSWIEAGTPRGEAPAGNRAPKVELTTVRGPTPNTLDVSVVVTDPDWDPTVGVLKIGDVALRMERGGAFSERLDTAKWPQGELPVSVTVCDGWASARFALGTVTK
jgi:hypothetical protein